MAAALRSVAAPATVGDRGDARLTQTGPGCWRLDGDLTLAAVAALAAQMPTADAAGQVTLDLAGVGRASSAGVALLLQWQAMLRPAGKVLLLHNAPAALGRLAELANVDGLLGLDAQAAHTNAAPG
ncbi:lipid asymmetry maintenance protein MlaB [Thiohalocapsa sp. ML1]|uniref:STAS domain-containing protein n=1 Tax=Thiohalocapsa sp. ML1 TaxID=1431688 RepID=UPI0007321809|nr:STAS domain-containing protein [Thiohalocapsa sp. ML1]